MASAQIDVDTTAFTISEKSVELDVGVTYTYWGWGDGEIIEWGDEGYLYITRAFQRNFDATSVVYTPKAVTFQTGNVLDVTSASFSINGSDVNLSDVTFPIDIDTTAYSVTSPSLTLEVGYQLNADTTAFSVSGSDIQPLYLSLIHI